VNNNPLELVDLPLAVRETADKLRRLSTIRLHVASPMPPSRPLVSVQAPERLKDLLPEARFNTLAVILDRKSPKVSLRYSRYLNPRF